MAKLYGGANPTNQGLIERIFSLEVLVRGAINDINNITVSAGGADLIPLRSLSGTANLSTNFGTFTGITIPDGATTKSALQALETALEAVNGLTVINDLTTGGIANALSAQQGVTIKALIDDINTKVGGLVTDLGTFTGTTIGDNLNVKDSIQALETALENLLVLATVISPASNDSIGSLGVSNEIARADHKHPAQPVSADANNSLTIGTDGLHFLTLDGNNTNILRANAVEDVEPTTGEVTTPITGDTAIVKLTNGTVEFWSFTTGWVKTFNQVPATLDGNRVNIVRVDAITGVVPTLGEVAAPINGDTAVVFLTDGIIEYYAHNGTAWALVNTVTPLELDGNDTHIFRANDTTGASPTVGEITTPLSGDTAKVILTDGQIEMYSHNGTVWALDGTYNPNKDRLFADETTVAPAEAGIPTEAEISTFLGSNKNVIVVYNGTDVDNGTYSYVYHVDNSGNVTKIDSLEGKTIVKEYIVGENYTTDELVRLTMLGSEVTVRMTADLISAPTLSPLELASMKYISQDKPGTWAASSPVINGFLVRENGVIYTTTGNLTTDATDFATGLGAGNFIEWDIKEDWKIVDFTTDTEAFTLERNTLYRNIQAAATSWTLTDGINAGETFKVHNYITSGTLTLTGEVYQEGNLDNQTSLIVEAGQTVEFNRAGGAKYIVTSRYPISATGLRQEPVADLTALTAVLASDGMHQTVLDDGTGTRVEYVFYLGRTPVGDDVADGGASGAWVKTEIYATVASNEIGALKQVPNVNEAGVAMTNADYVAKGLLPLIDGYTLASGATDNPKFALMFPTFVSGNDLVVPSSFDGAFVRNLGGNANAFITPQGEATARNGLRLNISTTGGIILANSSAILDNGGSQWHNSSDGTNIQNFGAIGSTDNETRPDNFAMQFCLVLDSYSKILMVEPDLVPVEDLKTLLIDTDSAALGNNLNGKVLPFINGATRTSILADFENIEISITNLKQTGTGDANDFPISSYPVEVLSGSPTLSSRLRVLNNTFNIVFEEADITETSMTPSLFNSVNDGVWKFQMWGVKKPKTVIRPEDVVVDDQATSGYMDIGNMRMQWGSGTAGTTVNFPVSFSAAPTVTITGQFNADRLLSLNTVSAVAFDGVSWNTGTNLASSGEVFNWQAIGLKP